MDDGIPGNLRPWQLGKVNERVSCKSVNLIFLNASDNYCSFKKIFAKLVSVVNLFKRVKLYETFAPQAVGIIDETLMVAHVTNSCK